MEPQHLQDDAPPSGNGFEIDGYGMIEPGSVEACFVLIGSKESSVDTVGVTLEWLTGMFGVIREMLETKRIQQDHQKIDESTKMSSYDSGIMKASKLVKEISLRRLVRMMDRNLDNSLFQALAIQLLQVLHLIYGRADMKEIDAATVLPPPLDKDKSTHAAAAPGGNEFKTQKSTSSIPQHHNPIEGGKTSIPPNIQRWFYEEITSNDVIQLVVEALVQHSMDRRVVVHSLRFISMIAICDTECRTLLGNFGAFDGIAQCLDVFQKDEEIQGLALNAVHVLLAWPFRQTRFVQVAKSLPLPEDVEYAKPSLSTWICHAKEEPNDVEIKQQAYKEIMGEKEKSAWSKKMSPVLDQELLKSLYQNPLFLDFGFPAELNVPLTFHGRFLPVNEPFETFEKPKPAVFSPGGGKRAHFAPVPGKASGASSFLNNEKSKLAAKVTGELHEQNCAHINASGVLVRCLSIISNFLQTKSPSTDSKPKLEQKEQKQEGHHGPSGSGGTNANGELPPPPASESEAAQPKIASPQNKLKAAADSNAAKQLVEAESTRETRASGSSTNQEAIEAELEAEADIIVGHTSLKAAFPTMFTKEDTYRAALYVAASVYSNRLAQKQLRNEDGIPLLMKLACKPDLALRFVAILCLRWCICDCQENQNVFVALGGIQLAREALEEIMLLDGFSGLDDATNREQRMSALSKSGSITLDPNAVISLRYKNGCKPACGTPVLIGKVLSEANVSNVIVPNIHIMVSNVLWLLFEITLKNELNQESLGHENFGVPLLTVMKMYPKCPLIQAAACATIRMMTYNSVGREHILSLETVPKLCHSFIVIYHAALDIRFKPGSMGYTEYWKAKEGEYAGVTIGMVENPVKALLVVATSKHANLTALQEHATFLKYSALALEFTINEFRDQGYMINDGSSREANILIRVLDGLQRLLKAVLEETRLPRSSSSKRGESSAEKKKDATSGKEKDIAASAAATVAAVKTKMMEQSSEHSKVHRNMVVAFLEARLLQSLQISLQVFDGDFVVMENALVIMLSVLKKAKELAGVELNEYLNIEQSAILFDLVQDVLVRNRKMSMVSSAAYDVLEVLDPERLLLVENVRGSLSNETVPSPRVVDQRKQGGSLFGRANSMKEIVKRLNTSGQASMSRGNSSRSKSNTNAAGASGASGATGSSASGAAAGEDRDSPSKAAGGSAFPRSRSGRSLSIRKLFGLASPDIEPSNQQ